MLKKVARAGGNQSWCEFKAYSVFSVGFKLLAQATDDFGSPGVGKNQTWLDPRKDEIHEIALSSSSESTVYKHLQSKVLRRSASFPAPSSVRLMLVKAQKAATLARVFGSSFKRQFSKKLLDQVVGAGAGRI
jgi:hypothetical protein